ncbi:Gfo/Idh/MocA family oxidoreductase [Halobacteria archaeon AArc-m2/3/4]|uniref:Gfo/Idh/MocA family oxidoreductase n=1 Tax=Natronoglomus mannanivorans TaxID=2979990 RepID=A0AAP3E2X3_9EURY|nr:Gfo/Idh/MocA family oxidoreductase [Halobacteria archaeon AArc-xg1-1]MCU4972283.1 Gfo/Idh/MocA family oxidoreductase [Halobacteria archaeon AArc-m2/3/4]
MAYTAAVIGTGQDPDNPSSDGYAMGYDHADGYVEADGVELVACADIVRENAQAFADNYGIDDDNVFEDYNEMVDEVDPDIVSVTVPPAIHASISIDCIRNGVRAVHCEKPMALTWGESRTMAQEAYRHDCLLTFNHQRRFGKPIRMAKQLLDDGEIGELERVEMGGHNLYDYGSHSFDLCNYFNDEVNAEWVLAQIDYREETVYFGAHNENQAIAHWQYENGVRGVAMTGVGQIPTHNRIVGTEGMIDIGPYETDAELRIRRGDGWEDLETDGEGMHDVEYIYRGIQSAVDALETGEPSELSARNALNATEIIFGAWESARRRGRVEFPLEVDDNPLEAMVESGQLTPVSSDE